MKKLNLTYIVVFFISKIVASIKLEGQPSHARRRFLRTLKPFVQDLEAEQDELRKKLADKNDKGEVKIDNGSYVFTAHNRKQFNKGWDALNETVVTLDVSQSNEPDVLAVQKVLVDEADKFEKEQTGGTDADAFEYIASLREAAEALTLKD